MIKELDLFDFNKKHPLWLEVFFVFWSGLFCSDASV
jgi:hypothetical protein